MKNSTYAKSTAGIALSTSVAEAFKSRSSFGTTVPGTGGVQVEVPGRYVVGANGRAEVVVRVDPNAFNRAMAVRKINEQIDGNRSVDLSTAGAFLRNK